MMRSQYLLAVLLLLIYYNSITAITANTRTSIKINRDSSSSNYNSNNNNNQYQQQQNQYQSSRNQYNPSHSNSNPVPVPATSNQLIDNPHTSITLTNKPNPFILPPESIYNNPTDNELTASTVFNWSALNGSCWTYSTDSINTNSALSVGYLYTVCPFQNLTQTNLQTGETVSLGSFSHWKQSIYGNGLLQRFNSGSVCINTVSQTANTDTDTTATAAPTAATVTPIARKSKIWFICTYPNDLNNTITDATTTAVVNINSRMNNNLLAQLIAVTELKPCIYTALLYTPLACNYSPYHQIPNKQLFNEDTNTNNNNANTNNKLSSKPISTSINPVIDSQQSILSMQECINLLVEYHSNTNNIDSDNDSINTSESLQLLKHQLPNVNQATELLTACSQYWDNS